MLDFLPFPKIDGDSVEKKIAQINSYLIQFKEAIEFALGSMSDENKTMSESLAKSLNASNETREDELTQVSSHISKDNDSVTSLIEQTAEDIRLEISKKTSEDDVKSLIEQTAEDINLEISKKTSEDDVKAIIHMNSDGEIEIAGNKISIESDKFKLTKDGNIEMLSGKIKIVGTVTKYASDYTQADADRANDITLGLVSPTVADFEKLDLDGDGVINIRDAAMIKRLLDGLDAKREIYTSIDINPLNAHGVLKTEGVFVGANGIFTNCINSEKTYMKQIYVMQEGGGFGLGTSGSFTTADSKTITVTNGIITHIT